MLCRTVQQVEVTPADCGAGDLQDHISVFENLRFRNLDHFHLLLALPNQRLHCLALVSYALGIVVGDVLLDILLVMADNLFGRVGCL